MGLLKEPRLIYWTTKSPIRSNHWVPLGMALLNFFFTYIVLHIFTQFGLFMKKMAMFQWRGNEGGKRATTTSITIFHYAKLRKDMQQIVPNKKTTTYYIYFLYQMNF